MSCIQPSTCVNWLGNLSSDEGNTSENITWKYIFLFVLLTSTEIASYPVIKLVGVALKLRELNEKFAVVLSRSQQNPEFGHFTLMFCRGRQRTVTKFKTHVQNCCFCSLNLCFVAFSLLSQLSLLSSLIRRQLPNFNGTDTKIEFYHETRLTASAGAQRWWFSSLLHKYIEDLLLFYSIKAVKAA